MKKLFILFTLLALVLTGCATVNQPAPTAPTIEAPPCDGQAKVLYGKEVVANGRILVFIWLDNTCDGQCDAVAVVLYLGKFEGKPAFQPLGLITCEEADETIAKLKADNKKTTGGA